MTSTAWLYLGCYVEYDSCGGGQMRLEDPDEMISLRRAGDLSGVSPGTLRNQAIAGKLQTRKLGPRMLVTTRRWLHAYLLAASGRDKGSRLPLPQGYRVPDAPGP